MRFATRLLVASLLLAPAAHAQSVGTAIHSLENAVDALAADTTDRPKIPESELADLR